MSRLILIRGLPGSGKSTEARRFEREGYIHLETDMWFLDTAGQYQFDASRLKDAHQWCQYTTRILLNAGKNVVVSNTFVKKWEMAAYLAMVPASSLRIVAMTGSYGSVHNVPAEVIERMRLSWEQ